MHTDLRIIQLHNNGDILLLVAVMQLSFAKQLIVWRELRVVSTCIETN